MAEEMREDPVGTVAATTEEDDMVAESTAIEVTDAEVTATGTRTTPDPGMTARATENPEAWGTPGERSETGRMEGGTTAVMAGAPTTVTRTPEAAATAAWSPEDGGMELRSTSGDRLFATTPEEVHRNNETPRQYE